jgi:glycosyltransferase involved in cell wall biosynthesis
MAVNKEVIFNRRRSRNKHNGEDTMNIIMVNGGADLYGASRILLHAIKILRPRKIILFVPKTGLLTEYIRDNEIYAHVKVVVDPSVPVIYRKMGIAEATRLLIKMIAFKRKVKKIIREENITWAYINTLSCLMAMRVLKSCGLKIWLHVHEILENDRRVTRSINRSGIKWADKIIAVSEPVRQNLLDVSGHLTDKIVTVLNGIPDKYQPPQNKKVNGSEIISVTLFGRIKPEKGIWFFLEAIALLPAHVLVSSRFVIAGGPAPGGEFYLHQLKEDIAAHPANRQIEFRSFIPDITEALNATDIVVVPSLMKDPFPTTILEGLSAGKPVIATNTGGSVQSIKDNVTGFLIDPGDKQQFADKLQALIESDTLRTKMGAAAREDFLKKFTFGIFEERLMKEVSSFEESIVQ